MRRGSPRATQGGCHVPSAYRNSARAALAKAAGGSIDIVNLPEAGLRGNSHFLMMEKNNAEIADLIQKWLAGEGLVD